MVRTKTITVFCNHPLISSYTQIYCRLDPSEIMNVSVCLSVLWSKWICLCCWNACRDKLSFKTEGENLIWECGSNMIQPLDVILVHVLEVTLTLLHQTWLQSSLLCLVVTITLRTVFWHGVQSVVSTLLIESSM